MRAAPVESASSVATRTLNVNKAVGDVNASDYVGVLIRGGAKSPALLAESAAVRQSTLKHPHDVNERS